MDSSFYLNFGQISSLIAEAILKKKQTKSKKDEAPKEKPQEKKEQGTRNKEQATSNQHTPSVEAAPGKPIDISKMEEVVLMPRLSDTMIEGVIADWHKNVGD